MPREKEEIAAKPMSFEGGLIPDTGAFVNANPNVPRSIASHGSAALDVNDSGVKDRVAAGVKRTLLQRMQEVNVSSHDEAVRMKNEHTDHQRDYMNPAIAKAKAAVAAVNRAQAAYYLAMARYNPDDGQKAYAAVKPFATPGLNSGTGWDKTFFTDVLMDIAQYTTMQKKGSYFTRRKWLKAMNSAGDLAKTKMKEAQEAVVDLPVLAAEWKDYQQDYHKNSVMARYAEYDSLAMKYYIVAREDAQSLDTGFKRPDEAGYDPAVDRFAKQIEEYTGVYNPGDLYNAYANMMPDRGGNPYPDYRVGLVSALAKGELGAVDNNLDRVYTEIDTTAFGPGVRDLNDETFGDGTAPRRNIRIDNHFRGYDLEEGKEEIEGINQIRRLFGEDTEQNNTFSNPQPAANLGLLVDESGRNGEALSKYSTAKVYTAKNKNGELVEGFFLNGEFVPADRTKLRSQDETAYFGTPNWDKVARQERLRNAIRRSDFFRHVNSATISYYMTYNGYAADGSVSQAQAEEGGILSERNRFFSATTLVQGLASGKVERAIGLGASAVLDGLDYRDSAMSRSEYEQKNSGRTEAEKEMPEFDAKYAVWSDFAEFQTRLYDFKEDPEVASLVGAISLIGGGIGAASKGAVPLITMLNSIIQGVSVIKQVGEIFREDKGRLTGGNKAKRVIDLINAALKCISSISDFLTSVFSMASADLLAGITTAVSDLVNMTRGIMTDIRSIITRYQIHQSNKDIRTALGDFKRGQGAEQAMGRAAAANAQSQFFLSLATANVRKEAIEAAFETAAYALDATATVIGMGEKSAWINPISFGFKVAGKAAEFFGLFTEGANESVLRKENVARIFGSSDALKTPDFDTILREETGIKSRYYLNDLARVFMAVDMHAYATHNAQNTGDEKLVITTLHSFVPQETGESYAAYRQRIKLDNILEAVGASKDWRGVLQKSIAG